MDVRAELGQLLDDVLGDDPRLALIAYRRLADDELPWIEQKVVALARREGWNWAKIGRLLGRSRSSVLERFRNVRIVKRPDPRAAQTRYEYEYLRITNRHLREDVLDDDPIAW